MDDKILTRLYEYEGSMSFDDAVAKTATEFNMSKEDVALIWWTQAGWGEDG